MYVQGTSGARGLGITKNVRGYVSKYFYGEKMCILLGALLCTQLMQYMLLTVHPN